VSQTRLQDWNPETYARFRGLRLRPALDLMMQIGTPGAGPVVDLGCGDGAVVASLRARFPKRQLVGVDASAAMLGRARGYDRLHEVEIGAWRPETPPAVIFSNAALHWLPDHATLMPRLAGFLAPGGVLAVQMPGQHAAPSHALAREIAGAMFPDRLNFSDWRPAVADPRGYAAMLAPLGEVNAWESTYLHRLAASRDGHPVRRFTESTALLPILEGSTADERRAFLQRYDAAMARAYPAESDGSVLFPFRRVFFVLTIPA
jgi:trans-aconitate 2-methyltransferase